MKLVQITTLCACLCFATAAAQAQQTPTSSSGGPEISNAFFQSDLRQALEDIAAQARVNIVATPEVSGLVTVTISNRNVETALDLVLAGTGYSFTRFPNYILVYDPEFANSGDGELLQTRIFVPINLDSQTAFDLLPERLQRNVRISENSNIVSVTAAEPVLSNILNILAQLDSEMKINGNMIALQYVSVETLNGLMPPALSQNVRTDPERNAVLIHGTRAEIQKIEELIYELDIPLPRKAVVDDPIFPVTLVHLRHSKAADIVEMLPESMQRFVSADPQANRLSIAAPYATTSDIEANILALDARKAEVRLEAKVVALDSVDFLNYGADFEWPRVTAGTTYIDGQILDNTQSTFEPWEVRVGYSPTRQFTNALNVNLELLSKNNDATIVSTPRVTTQDGAQAEIQVTTAEYFQLAIERDGFFTADLEEIETGTVLNITPRVGTGPDIGLEIDVTVSDVVARGEDNLPIVVSRRATSQISVENGGTAVVAGLVDTRKRRENKGLPGLRHLPLLGPAFSATEFEHEVKQVAIFVTAHIVGAESPESPFKHKSKPQLNEKAFQDALRQELLRREQ